MNYTHPLTARARELGLSNRQLAAKAGVSPSYVDRLTRPNLADTNCIRRPSIDALGKLARVLDTEPDQLIDQAYQTIVVANVQLDHVVGYIPERVVRRDLQADLSAAINKHNRASYGLAGATA